MLGIVQTSPNVPFPYANFVLYPFSIINHSWNYDYMLSPMNPPRKSSNLGVDLGTPPYLYVFSKSITLDIQINQ